MRIVLWISVMILLGGCDRGLRSVVALDSPPTSRTTPKVDTQSAPVARSGPYVDLQAPPIVQAAQRGDIEAVRRIVKEDWTVLWDTDSNNNTAVSWAILNDHHEIAIHLIESGFPVNPQDVSDFPLVMSCISRYSEGSRKMLLYLLKKGADPNVRYEPEGWVALNMAANNGQEEMVRILVQHGAKLDCRERGLTPLEMAKQRVAKYSDPNFDLPHYELRDPQVRKRAIERWERMVQLLIQLEDGA